MRPNKGLEGTSNDKTGPRAAWRRWFSWPSWRSSGAARAEDAAEEHTIAPQEWSFGGFRGQYDQAQLQRGFQVFQQVCSACHGLKRVRFRNLAEPGGPEFPVAAVKALAASWPYQISGELDDEGHPIDRLPGLADPIIGPYKNDKEARAAQGGALPPDLSLIVRARTVESHAPWYTQWLWMLWDIANAHQDGGAELRLCAADRIHRCRRPACMSTRACTTTWPSRAISWRCRRRLSKDNVVEYQPDAGAKASFEQNARDITAFLAWAADPSLDARKELGWQVLLYLVITTLLLYVAKRRIWARVKH